MNNTNQPFNILIDEELSSIEFVRDYIQFRFDGPCLTAFTNPFIIVENKRYNRSDAGFCDILLSFIGLKVEETLLIVNEIIRIQFLAGYSINISLRPNDYVGVEAANFSNGFDDWWVW